MTPADAPDQARIPAIPGRATISSRAYEQLVRALARDALGVGGRDAKVRVSDAGGRLSIEVSGPVSGEGAPLLGRVGDARETLAARTTALTGAVVDRVAIRVTDILFSDRRTR